MIRKLLISSVMMYMAGSLYSQEPLEKFRDLVYTEIVITNNITYARDLREKVNKKYFQLDIYEPSRDNSPGRPLIIWIHGGAFKFGSKDAAGTKLWCETFARRGYVCAAVNYRLNKNPSFKNRNFIKGCYKAVQDLNRAISFFKANAKELRIDTNRIILAGNSAGAMVALQYAYSNYTDLEKLIDPAAAEIAGTDRPLSPVAAVINFWGAVFSNKWLMNAETPIVSVHGRKDRLVPITNKKTSMFGSYLIHRKADQLQIPNRLKIFDRHAHELHRKFIHPAVVSRATKQRWLEAGQFAADFLYDILMTNTEIKSVAHVQPNH